VCVWRKLTANTRSPAHTDARWLSRGTFLEKISQATAWDEGVDNKCRTQTTWGWAAAL